MLKLVKMKGDEDFIPDEPMSEIEDNVKPIAKSCTDMESITMKKVRYMIIEAVLWSMQEAGLQEAFAQNIGSNLQ